MQLMELDILGYDIEQGMDLLSNIVKIITFLEPEAVFMLS